MKRNIPLCVWGFTATLLTSIGLFVGGFFAPPMGVIDGSILTAAGILLGFAVIGQLPEMIRIGRGFRVTHGNTTIEVHKNEE